jgi:hypothetical protein
MVCDLECVFFKAVFCDEPGSAVGGVTHTRQNASHVGERLDDSGHGIVAMHFVFEIDKTLVFRGNEGFEDFSHRHEALAYGNLTFLALEIGQVFHVHVEEAGTYFMDSFDNIGAGAHCVAYIDAAADARVHILD